MAPDTCLWAEKLELKIGFCDWHFGVVEDARIEPAVSGFRQQSRYAGMSGSRENARWRLRCPSVRTNENVMKNGELMSSLFEVATVSMNTDQNCLNVEPVASDPVLEFPVSCSELRDMMKEPLNQLTNQLDARVAQVAEEFAIGTVENIDSDRLMTFVRGRLKRAIRDKLLSMMDDNGDRKAFKFAIV